MDRIGKGGDLLREGDEESRKEGKEGEERRLPAQREIPVFLGSLFLILNRMGMRKAGRKEKRRRSEGCEPRGKFLPSLIPYS